MTFARNYILIFYCVLLVFSALLYCSSGLFSHTWKRFLRFQHIVVWIVNCTTSSEHWAEDEKKSSDSNRKMRASYYALRNITREFEMLVKLYSCSVNMIFDDIYNDIFPDNHVTQSSTKVDADHSNDIHLSNDVFYLNRSTISSTEVSFLYSTFKTVIHLSIHFWADLSVNLKSFAIALFHLIQAFASHFFSHFNAWIHFFRFFFISAVILFLVCWTIIILFFWATDSSSLSLLIFALLWL